MRLPDAVALPSGLLTLSRDFGVATRQRDHEVTACVDPRYGAVFVRATSAKHAATYAVCFTEIERDGLIATLQRAVAYVSDYLASLGNTTPLTLR